MKFIVKKDEWFKEGTEVKLVDNFIVDTEGKYNESPIGLFEGIRVSQGEGNRPVGEEYLDQEMCLFEEFIISE